jgi:tetratricopeptide (TPR) repeat protein/sugar lactone lactonase YvrE
MAWCEEGDTLRSLGATDGELALWNAVTGKRLTDMTVPRGTSGQFNAGAKLLAIAAAADNRPRLQIHDARSGERLQTVKGIVPGVASFSPDAVKLAVANGDTLEVVNLRQNEVYVRWRGTQYNALCWSPDGRLLAAAVGAGNPGDDAAWVHVFDTEKRQRLFNVQHGASKADATAVAWSPDGKRLVSGNSNGLAEVWEVPSGHKITSAYLQTAAIKALAWSPDGRRVASGSADGTIRVWDPSRGEELLKLEVPGGDVTQVQWSSNGRRLAVATADGGIHIWDASAGYEYVHSQTYYFEQVHDRLSQAIQLWEAGRKDEALALYEQTLAGDKAKLSSFPRWVGMSLRSRARTAMNTGQDQEAIELNQLVARLNKDDGPYYNLALIFLRQGQWDKAKTACHDAIRINKDLFCVHNWLAWLLATCPDVRLRDPVQAVTHARQAVELRPDAAGHWNTLGVAHYCNGAWKSAVEALTKSVQLSNGGSSEDFFFLAMAHWQLGDKEQARTWYDRAVAWMEKNQPKNEELRRFRAEAAALLGLPPAAAQQKGKK